VPHFYAARTKIYFSYKTDVNAFSSLDSQTQFGPTFEYEYNTCETYGGSISGWGPNDPLNATWWHRVTEGKLFTLKNIHLKLSETNININNAAMEANSALVTVRIQDLLP
jgi:hypothetical protein